jgi:alpha-mannosidase
MAADIVRRQFLQSAVLAPVAGALGWPQSSANQPRRDWHVYVLNASHMDLGFQDLPDVIIQRELVILDQTIALCESTAEAEPTRRYKSTVEHSVLIDYFEQSRSPEQFQRLLACVRRGQIEIGAMYTSVHTDLCGHEELARLTAHAGSLRRRFGLPMQGAMLNDASEGYTMGLAQVLARSGVRYFCMGQGAKANLKGIEADVPRIFYWGGEDGSRVLVAWTPGTWTYNRFSAARFRGRKTLSEFEQLPDYPYNVMFRHGGKGDITSPDPKLLEVVASYRKEAPEAEVRLATMQDFFEPLEKRYASRIPTIAGDRANSWADGPISLAHETAVQRRTQSQLVSAEVLMTLAALDEKAAIGDAYKNLHLYSEHTWGFDFDADARPGHIRTFYRDISEGKRQTVQVPKGEALGPASPLMKDFVKAWDAKKSYAYKAEGLSKGVLDHSLAVLNTRMAASQPRVAVWNTLSWARKGIAHFEPPDGVGEIRRLRNCQTGAYVDVQRDDSAGRPRWCFLADQVPAFGCSLYEVELGEMGKTERAPGNAIENEFYRVRLDARTGALGSIFDRQRRTELVDSSAPYGMGQYIHANVNDFYEGSAGTGKSGFAYGPGDRYVPAPDQPVTMENGPVFSSLRIVSKLETGPAPARVDLRVVLYRGLKSVVLRNRVDKQAAMEKEQVYFAFPFQAGQNPQFQLELGYSTLRWPRDILPATWRGYASVRNWVRINGSRTGVTWTSLDAPVVCVGGITSNQWDPEWHRTYIPNNGHLYSYVMSNIWNCNYPLWQGGKTDFDYAITSGDPAEDVVESVRFGWDRHIPLEARWVPAAAREVQPQWTGAGIEVEPANVIVSAMKPAEDGKGTVLRLYETAGRSSQVRLRAGFRSFTAAHRASLVEEELEPLKLREDILQLEMRPHELVTLLLR